MIALCVFIGSHSSQERFLETHSLIETFPRRGLNPLSDEHFVPSPQERIHLARQIEKAEYRNFQACLHNSWIEQAAAALEIELDEEMYKGTWAAWDSSKGAFSCFSFLRFSLQLLSPWSLSTPTVLSKSARCLSFFETGPSPT